MRFRYAAGPCFVVASTGTGLTNCVVDLFGHTALDQHQRAPPIIRRWMLDASDLAVVERAAARP